MDKNILIIANKPISSAIMSVFGLLNSHSFTEIDPGTFPNLESLVDNLEKLKDNRDINALIVTDSLTFNERYPISDLFGIELVKHLRLTDSLGNLGLLPIILLSPEEITHHLKTKRDNIILTSSGIHLVHISFCLEGFFSIFDKAKPCESQIDMKSRIREFTVWSKEDGIVSSHDNFNRYGPCSSNFCLK